MSTYRPGQGISKESLERLRARKTADAAIADIPAEDRSQQWDRVLGEGNKKKIRCGICTRPLSAQEQEEKHLVCSACALAEAANGAGAVAGPTRSAFFAEELGPALFYYSWRALRGSPSAPRGPAPAPPVAAGATKAKGSAALPEVAKTTAPEAAAATTRRTRGETGEKVTQLERDSAVYRDKLVPEGHVGLGVLSFNLLAECYVRVKDQPWNAFDHCQDEHLAWRERLPRIVRLLQGSLADVICLQEVVLENRAPAAGGAKEWMLPAWTEQLEGYTGVLQGLKQKEWEKTSERNQKVIGIKVPTGLATFYRTAELEECQASKSGSGSGLTLFLRRRKAESGALEVAVANVHLVGDPTKSEEHAKSLSSVSKNFGKREHRVICGDFNGEAEPGSSVAEWAAVEGFMDAPTGTSWAEPGKAMRLDHVMHSPGLHVQAASAPLSADEVASGLPCSTCPSDHAPVAVLLTAAKRAERGKCPW